MAVDLVELKLAISTHLLRVETLLSEDYRLTLVARHKTNNDAHIVVTNDEDLESVRAAIEKLKKRPAL